MRRSLIGKALMLIGAALVLGLILIGVTGEITREHQEAHAQARNPQTSPSPDHAELQRCQTLGEAAAKDAACLALWAETRRRFLTPASPTSAGD
jgi:conjugative transfer region protein TrbK